MQISLKSQVINFQLPIVFLFLISPLFSDAIRLNSGQILEGKILEESDKVLIFQTRQGTFTIKRTDILEMERTGSKDVIIKPPNEKNLSIIKVTLLSFIPGYSPLYNSKEHPEFGIPLAMLSINSFYHFLQFQTNSRTVGYLNSIESKQPVGLINNYITGPTSIAREPFGTPNYPLLSSSHSTSFFIYTNIRAAIYNKHRDRVVEGQLMTEDEYLKLKKKHLSHYIGISVVNAAISYFILRNEGSLGALYKTDYNGIRTAFYAFPTNDGGIFATVSRF